jgi:tripartite-type tricarboxylate transporter receptor subunit TctC
VSSFYGLVAPAKTPDAIVKKISDTLKQSLASPEVRDRLATANLDAEWLSPEDFGKFLQGQITNWSQAAKTAGVEPK